ncbi:MAG TPA: hypothetical protein VEB64_18315 [Azospirillaceae bacterium]|nr:hypothetical protein [Azospirillaceae bacterium]
MRPKTLSGVLPDIADMKPLASQPVMTPLRRSMAGNTVVPVEPVSTPAKPADLSSPFQAWNGKR